MGQNKVGRADLDRLGTVEVTKLSIRVVSSFP